MSAGETKVRACNHRLYCEPTDGRDAFCALCGHTWHGSWDEWISTPAAGWERAPWKPPARSPR